MKIGILCLTPGNLTAPWILFEAGALSKALDDSLVCPYLFNLEPAAIGWPLAQFQLEKADREGTRKLLTTINSAAGSASLDAGRLAKSFETWWPDLERQLSHIEPSPSSAPIRLDRELLEEILNEVRRLRRDRHGFGGDPALPMTVLNALRHGNVKTPWDTTNPRVMDAVRSLMKAAEAATRASHDEEEGDETESKTDKQE